jgi:hypothetical protein
VGDSATFCATCGAAIQRAERQDAQLPTRRPRDTVRWAIVATVVALLSVAGFTIRASLASGHPALKPAAPPLYRLNQSGHLQAGMTPAQVAAMLGTPGSAYSSAGSAGSAPQFYIYLQNADGQSVQLYFQNGRLSQEVPGGLQ